MKKLLFIFFALALFWGCEKSDSLVHENEDELIDGEIADKEETDNPVTDYVLPEILYASMTDEDKDKPQTRTVVGDDGRKILWQNGDAVSYFAGNMHNARYTYTGEGGESTIELAIDAEKPGTQGALISKSHSVYPFDENITVVYDEKAGIDKINLTYPATQKYAANSFGKDANIMVAAGKNNLDNELFFRNACGYLVIKLYGSTKVKSITLSSVSGTDKIAGPAVVVASSDAAPVVTLADEASTAVTLDCSNGGEGVQLGGDKEHATEFWFALPPVSFTDGIKITVNDVNGNTYTKQTSNEVNIVRNEVQPMAALKFESNTPAPTKLWYTRSDDNKSPLAFYDGKTNPFNATIKSNGHYYDEKAGKFVIEFTSPLTTIQTEAFRDTEIATINMPEGVTTIEEGAFENSHLSEITIPGSVNNIGINVFYNCGNLSSVTFLPSPTKTPLNIGCLDWGSEWGPFYHSPLTSIDLNRELICVWEDGTVFTPTAWDEGMFAHKHYESVGSVSVTLGPQVETLSNYMFNYLPIQTLTIPGTVKTIGNCVFDGCESLTSLTYEPSPTGEALTHGYNDDSDDDGPFYASPLTSVNLNREINYTYSSSAGNASEGLFGNRTTLTSVTIGEQVKTLSPYMFANAAIEELVIPGTVKTIGNCVFDGCESLTSLTYEPSPTGEALTHGYNDDSDDDGPFYASPLTSVNLNREINYTYSSSAGNASEGLFGNRTTLTNVTLGDQVKTLHKYMFAGSGITSLNLNKVETIKEFALAGVGITELTIPGTVTTIHNDVFRGCTNLATLTFQPSSSEKPLAMGYDTDGEAENLFQDNEKLETLILNREIIYTLGESSIDTNSEGLFGGMPTLTSVTLGDQVKTLHKYMFAGSSITELIIPGSVNTIENDAFHGCKQLATLTFNPSPSVTALTMGYDTDGEAENLFQDNNKLKTLILNREIIYTLGESSIDTNSEGLFGGMPTLTSVTLGDQVKTLHKYMFAGSGITSLNLNKVETIKEFALAGVGITELTIPACVTEIKDFAFYNCQKLTDLTISSSTAPLTLGFQDWSDEVGPFYQSPLKNIKLGRNIVYNDNYAESCDSWDEGAFSNEYYDDDVEWTTDLILGSNVTTILKYMFAGTRIQQLHIPETVENIGVNVIENNDKLNAIIFYDETERPNVEYGAFGEDSVGLDLENYPPGKGQYYIFVPYRLGRLGSSRGELYYTLDDLVHDTYWDVLHAIMVDDQPRDDHYQPHRNTESWYLNVTGYEWYKARYYDYITITPPTI